MVDIPRLQRLTPITEADGTPSYPFHIWWDQVAQNLSDNFNNINEALAVMPGIADIHIQADYTGVVNAATFPVTVSAYRLNGSTDVTLLSTWSFTVDDGSLTATISNGVLSITAIGATSRVTITSVYETITRSQSFTVYLDIAAPPPPPPASGTTVSDNSLNSINSTTHAAISDELNVTVGSSGTVALTAPSLNVLTAAVSPIGTFKVYGKWQWWNGSAWVDVATEVSSSPDCVVTESSTTNSDNTGSYTVVKGVITVNTNKTGLTVGSSQKFRLMARNDSGARPMTFTGTATAAG